jgi:hypothetical protein
MTWGAMNIIGREGVIGNSLDIVDTELEDRKIPIERYKILSCGSNLERTLQ